jgi:iron complex outermembrane recepter protein
VLNSLLAVEPSNYYVYTPESEEPEGWSAVPVDMSATTTYYGYYLTDTFDITRDLSVTASGRYNIAEDMMTDHMGTNLDGNNRYTHFNPSLGFTYNITTSVNAFVGWAINNRAPTASEIECSSQQEPCLLPAGLAGDPPTLKQVVSHSYEAGLRGAFAAGLDPSAGRYTWNVSVFRTDNENDIYAVFIPDSINTGYFTNVGSTRRQGVDADFKFESHGFHAYAQYSYVDATFESAFTESSSSNPFADAEGNIQVMPGDRIPGVPLHRFKAGADYELLRGWRLGASVIVVSPQFYLGDESNQNPEIPGYHVFDLYTNYQVTRWLELFGTIDNLFNEKYATFGVYSDPTGIGAPGVPPNGVTNGPGVDNRFLSPAAPFSFFAGFRLKY